MKSINNSFKVLMGIFVISCQGFYDYSRIGDVYRVPLLKPCEVRSNSHGDSWHINLPFKTILNLQEISNINSVGMKDSLILIYSERIYVPTLSKMTEAWFIINMKEKKEYVFDNKAEFSLHLKNIEEAEIPFYKIKEVFKHFDKKRQLPEGWHQNK